MILHDALSVKPLRGSASRFFSQKKTLALGKMLDKGVDRMAGHLVLSLACMRALAAQMRRN